MSCNLIDREVYEKLGTYLNVIFKDEMYEVCSGMTTDKIINMLYKQNNKSVNVRYAQNNKVKTIKITSKKLTMTDIEVIKLIDSIIYQSCETKSYFTSKAYIILIYIKSKIMMNLLRKSEYFKQYYNEAKWF